MKVKYNRVSTLQQTGNRFEADTDHYDLTLMDKVSGTVKFSERPEAQKLIKLINDKRVTTVVVEELSRIGRLDIPLHSTPRFRYKVRHPFRWKGRQYSAGKVATYSTSKYATLMMK